MRGLAFVEKRARWHFLNSLICTIMKNKIQGRFSRSSQGHLFVACALLVIGMATSSRASTADSDALKQARDRMLIGAEVLTDENFAYDGVTPFSMAFIAKGSFASMNTPLEKGVPYAILGVGDDDATDIDVIVQDSKGNVMAQDLDDSDTAVATFTPRYGGNYTVFVNLPASEAETSACSLSIFRKGGGFKLTNDSVKNTTDTMFDAVQEVHNKYETIYHSGTGQWAIVGSVLKSGASSTFSGMPTKEGFYAFLAVGDEDMRDLNMKIRDANDKVLLKDVDPDDTAVCVTTFTSRQTVSIELTNAKSDEFSLVLHAVLHKDE